MLCLKASRIPKQSRQLFARRVERHWAQAASGIEFLDLSLVETSFVFHFKKILNLDKKRVLEAESCSMTNEEEDVFLLYFELTAT